MLEFTRQAIASGRPMEEVLKTPAIPGFEGYEGPPAALQAAYQEAPAEEPQFHQARLSAIE